MTVLCVHSLLYCLQILDEYYIKLVWKAHDCIINEFL